MVVKKSSSENTKDVKKKTTSLKKPLKKDETPKIVKEASKKVTVSKKDIVKAKSVTAIKKETTSYNPVDEVLQIKAKNEEKTAKAQSKKVAKAAAKETKKAVKMAHEADLIEEKGNKAVSDLKRRDEMRENALKAETKKFLAMKEETHNQECSHICAFTAFVDAYKKIFTYNARTTRYEFWSFKLINLLFSLIILGGLLIASNYTSSLVIGSVVIGFALIEFLVYIALFARRLHDTGRDAWKGFFGPMVYSLIIYLVAIGCFKYYSLNNNFDIFDEQYALTFAVFSLFILVVWTINTYYSIKTLIVSFFFEEDKKENEYGMPKLINTKYQNKSVRFASIYFVILMFLAVIMKVFYSFYALSYGYNG